MKIREVSELISHARLLELAHYDRLTGLFTLKIQRGKHPIGMILGTLHHTGYIIIGLDQVNYQASRLAWFYVTGEWPSYILDHEDRCRSNNRWLNLRPATDALNRANSVSSGQAGAKGVTLRQRYKTGKPRWVAQISHAGHVLHLGNFDAKDEAAGAYSEVAIKLFGEFAGV